MLKIENLSATMHHKKVLNDISFQVKPGEVAILLGQSGVGKSTLLRVLTNVQPYNQGTVSYNGKLINLAQVNATHLIGMVFQQFNLFENLTAKENITLVLEKIMKKNKNDAAHEANALLQSYGLAEYASHYPSQLSGGQKQRLALARTLATKPHIICMDEPTSALDPLFTKTVAHTIKDLARKNYTVIVATHDLGLVQQLDGTLYLMHEGSIAASANAKEYFATPEKYPHIKEFMRA